MSAGQPPWKLFPHLIVRTTGFSYGVLEQVRQPRSLQAVRESVRLQKKLQALRDQAPRIRRPPNAVLSALRAGRPVDTAHLTEPELFSEWNQAAQAALAAEDAFRSAFDAELESADRTLRDFANTSRFKEAVASSSPPIFVDIERGRWSPRLERQVASYLQRLCAKNETMSFFGPINYGRVDPLAKTGVSLTWSGAEHLKARRTHLASWLVNGLVEKIAFDPGIAPWLVLRRKGFSDPPIKPRRKRLGEILLRMRHVTLQQLEATLALQSLQPKQLGELLVETNICTPAQVEEALLLQQGRASAPVPNDAAPPEPELLSRLVRAADGTASLTQLARKLNQPLAQLTALAQLACERRFLTHQLAIPPASHQPLNDLSEHLAGIPGPAAHAHLKALSQLFEGLDSYGSAGATDKVRINEALRIFAQETWAIGAAPASHPKMSEAEKRSIRGEGQHFYVDRLPLREECGGDLRLQVGGARATELIEQMGPVLELLSGAAIRTHNATREHLARLLGARKVPFWMAAAAFSDRPIPYDSTLSDALHQAVTDSTQPEWSVTSSVSKLIAATPVKNDVPVVCSIDLLIAAPSAEAWSRGDYTLVVGDTHDTVLVWGWALQFHEERDHVEQQMIRALGTLPKNLPVVTILSSRRTGLLPSEFPGPVVELGGVSVRPNSWQLPFDDLFVVSDGSTCHLYSESLASEVYLYNGELESLVHTAFALPRIRSARVDLGAHTPRLTLDKVVLQREQWRLTEKQAALLLDGKDDKARMRAICALWDELRIPEVTFAKFPAERKPVLLDIGSPLLIRVFLNLLQRRGPALLSEMLPAPADLWLSHEGQRHTSELRCTFLRNPGAGP